MNALQITVPIIFVVSAIVMAFFRRLPSALVAYFGFVSAGMLGTMHITANMYVLWGIIALVDTINIYSTRLDPPQGMRLYTVTGCLVGSLLGVLGGNLAAVFCAGALGAILGFIAFCRTPRGRLPEISMAKRLTLLMESGCTAWFTFVLAAVVLGRILAPSSINL